MIELQAQLPWQRPPLPFPASLRRRVGAALVDNFFLQTARLGRMLPVAHPRLHGVEVLRDQPYSDSGADHHLLDVWRPKASSGPLPVVLYIHGGGFRVLSKDTHWIFGLAFARRGYLVFNINYRLAPAHPYPAAISDAALAYEWVTRNAHRFGGDLSRLVVAGESAGANLATGVALASVFRREEPFAKRVFDTGVVPRAVFAACGILQVSDPERFLRRKRLRPWVHDRLAEVADAYFHRCELRHPRELDFADPLVLLERGIPPERPLPAFFAPCGTRDPLLDDTRRLAAAVERLGGKVRARYYPGELHAFHAFLFRRNARACWRELFDFLNEHLGAPPR
ncbi:MAG: alpha/beta hydrolase fold domain-containing protein [Myxococcaceae bacterium]|nr:alpha/beta hydrolase fold domain-containing protein [Myxococcaceae bacterium]